MLTDTILDNPVASAALTVVLIVAVAYIREIGPRRAIVGETVRRVVQPLADRALGNRVRTLTREKAAPSASDEYIVSVSSDVGVLELARALWKFGYRWNPISTKKYRVVDGRRQYAILSVALRDGVLADDQHHVYVFRGADGKLDIYGHREANVTHVNEHEGGDEQAAGDPDGVLRDALARSGIGFTSR